MTAIERAIKDAKAQGWKQQLPKFVLNTTVISNPDLLDPSFWQALGRARGWNKTPTTDVLVAGEAYKERWAGYWHRFIDHLADGKDAESFFAKL